MSILTIVQNACLELGLPKPSTVVTSTDRTVLQMLALAVDTGRDVTNDYDWPQLQKEYTLTLVSGQESYPMPGDFAQMIDETEWDRSNHWKLIGSLSPQEWQVIKSGSIANFPRTQFRIKGSATNQFFVSPTPSASEDGHILAFEYLTTNWVRPKTWTTTTSFSAQTYCWYNGNVYYTTLGGTTGATAPTHTSGSVSDGGVTWTYFSEPYDKFYADTDISLIDEQIIKAACKWRFMESKRLQYQELKKTYQTLLAKSVASLTGAPTLTLSRARTFKRFISPFNVPDTGYGN